MSDGARKVLALLRRAPASTYVLARANVGDIRARIAELREAGYEIDAEREQAPGWPVVNYRLVSEPQLALFGASA